jgi:uncharacterized SAM-binding protein YcdF (DUF218 family)
MFLALKGVAHALFLPPTVFLVLALIAYGFLFSRWRRQATIALGVALGLLWVFSMPAFADLLWRATERYPALNLDRPVKAQAIVVIGGFGYRWKAPEYGGTPVADNGLLERLTYTAYLAKKTGLPVLVSGDDTEAIAMRTTLERDFDIRTRWMESQSRDTFENAQLTAKLLHADGIRHIILVTSSTHIWRAAHEFTSAGFTVDPAPAIIWAPRPSEGLFELVPAPWAISRSYEAVYELVGDPVRVMLSALHIRRQAP